MVLSLGSGRSSAIGTRGRVHLADPPTLHVRLVAPLPDRIAYMSQWMRLNGGRGRRTCAQAGHYAGRIHRHAFSPQIERHAPIRHGSQHQLPGRGTLRRPDRSSRSREKRRRSPAVQTLNSLTLPMLPSHRDLLDACRRLPLRIAIVLGWDLGRWQTGWKKNWPSPSRRWPTWKRRQLPAIAARCISALGPTSGYCFFPAGCTITRAIPGDGSNSKCISWRTKRIADRQGYLGVVRIERDEAQLFDRPRGGQRLVQAKLLKHRIGPVEKPLLALRISSRVFIGIL